MAPSASRIDGNDKARLFRRAARRSARPCHARLQMRRARARRSCAPWVRARSARRRESSGRRRCAPKSPARRAFLACAARAEREVTGSDPIVETRTCNCCSVTSGFLLARSCARRGGSGHRFYGRIELVSCPNRACSANRAFVSEYRSCYPDMCAFRSVDGFGSRVRLVAIGSMARA